MKSKIDFKSMLSTRDNAFYIYDLVKNNPEINVKRLERLANYLDTHVRLHLDHFSMTEWFEVNNSPFLEPDTKPILEHKDLKRQNTKACAVGWAAMIPEFRRAGFKPCVISVNKLNGIEYSTNERWDYGDIAINRFFGLSDMVNLWLFSQCWYKKSSDGQVPIDAVIKRLQFVVDLHKQFH